MKNRLTSKLQILKKRLIQTIKPVITPAKHIGRIRTVAKATRAKPIKDDSMNTNPMSVNKKLLTTNITKRHIGHNVTTKTRLRNNDITGRCMATVVTSEGVMFLL